ncbi:hypothetical protein G6Z25_02390 [Clostridium perfringens]|uniref:hypothetical protein n=1 Tax=Clostridium perfringens TaxID=1502 RepID=UPI0013E2B1CF|nr:hypothetical protein [Clostridium perfringens]NGS95769.1 hypothetical protein [Clostridium perfringens]
MDKELIKLKDGYIKEIYTDTDYTPGCETCDYGSEYINEFTVYLSSRKVEIKISDMYEYVLSEDYLIKLFIRNLDEIKRCSEEEFIEWLRYKIDDLADKENCDYSFEVI